MVIFSGLQKKPNNMNIEELRNFCLSLKGAEESMPFNDKKLELL
jgi:hypothetical protein